MIIIVMVFEKISSPILSEWKSKPSDWWFFRRIFHGKEDTKREEALKWDREKQDAENLLKGLPTTKKEKAREITENWEVITPEKLALLLKNVPPERQKIIDMAKSYLWTNEKNNSDLIAQFHKSAWINNWWCETAWCMSFVQQVLKDLGKQPAKPTAWAKDWLKIGTPVNQPNPWDLVIVERGDGGHIGFYIGKSGSGNPIIIWWNQGSGEVSVKEETRAVLWYRSIA